MRWRQMVSFGFFGVLIFTNWGCGVTTLPRYTNRTGETFKSPQSQSVKNSTAKSGETGGITKRWELYSIVKDLIYTPYVWGGTKPLRGMDCSGLTYYAFKEKLGYEIPRTARDQYRQGQPINPQDIQFGDLVFFSNTPKGQKITHVGIYVNNQRFLHASSSRGVIVSRLNTPYWEKRVVGFRRYLTN